MAVLSRCICAFALAATAAGYAPVARPAVRARATPPAMVELPFGLGGDKVEKAAETAAALDVENTEAPVVPSKPSSGAAADIFAALSDVELAEQEAKLQALSDKWKRREDEEDYQSSIRSGWGPSPEAINGRTAMFFILVGLITEYYTGQSLPQQVYTMLQSLAIVD